MAPKRAPAKRASTKRASAKRPAASVKRPAAAASAAADESAGASAAADADDASESADTYKIFSLAESARTKGMWAGALEPTEIPGLAGVVAVKGDSSAAAAAEGDPPSYRIRPIERPHTPALLKIVDEALVNASDHWKEHAKAPKASRVTQIALDFDPSTGEFVVLNDGPGIPVELHEGATSAAGHDVYVPEVAFAVFLAGRNMEKPPDSVKGGINGIGAKLINVHSTEFTVETVAKTGGSTSLTAYQQSFRDRMETREEPAVFKVASAEGRRRLPEGLRRKAHTRLTFTPAYAALGYGGGAKPPLSPQDASDLEAWCRWRMFLLAAYVGPGVEVLFNGERCPTTSAAALAELATADSPGAVVLSCAAKATAEPQKSHPWDVAVAVVPEAKRFEHISVVNGVHTAKGSHVNFLKSALAAAIKDQVSKTAKGTKALTPAEACRNVYLVMVGALPGADWGGQRKDELQVTPAKLTPYKLAPTALRQIAQGAAEQIVAGSEKGVKRRQRVVADKYTGAHRAGTARAAECALLTAEGDSAIALLRQGLRLGPKNPGGPSFETHGVFSLGGVIINALNETTAVQTAAGRRLVRSDKLTNNKTLKNLTEILGLDYTCRYETDAEVARLRYGSVVICTDQDLDGTGKILPLVLVWFHTFWPALIRRGFVKRFVTPVIRAYPKKRGARGGGARGGAAAAAAAAAGPVEFTYENEFASWVAENGGDDVVSRAYDISYYKGLAGHDGEEVRDMFRRYDESIYTFTLDDGAARLFHIYYGPEPDLRKEVLATPVVFPSAEANARARETQTTSCETQLNVDAKAYKLDDIGRKIPSALDGTPIARRKVAAGALRRFAQNNGKVKVFQLGGYVAEHMFYHHGDAALNGAIVGMAQRYPGALNYPLLVGLGQFGTRDAAGGDAGSPRYISVRLAAPYARAMFPAEDMPLLPHVYEDGERAQPEFLMPVLPTALLESLMIPSEGWAHRSYARDLGDVVALTRAYIAGGLADDAATRERYPLRVSLRGYGEHLGFSEAERREKLVRMHNGRLHSFGVYELEGPARSPNAIRVRELPLRQSTQSFLAALEKGGRDALIADVRNESSDVNVDIRIRLASGAWAAIQTKYGGTKASSTTDAVEEFLTLRKSLQSFLNYFSDAPGGGVLEFGEDYHKIFFHWAARRREFYRLRLERERAVLDLKILLEESVVAYVTHVEEGLSVAEMDDEERAAAALKEIGLPRLNAGLIRSPGHTPTAELRRAACGDESDSSSVTYDYLLGLPQRDLVQSAQERRRARIAELKARLGEVDAALAEQPFPGASIWAAEVVKATDAIALGEKTNWKFE